MFRIWGKIFKDNHLVRDMVYENGDTDINRTKKVFAGIHAFAEAFDLQQPIWLDKNINEFKRVDKPALNKIISSSKSTSTTSKSK